MCSALKEIHLSGQIHYLGPNIFLYCDNLEHYEIPEEITELFSRTHKRIVFTKISFILFRPNMKEI